MHLHLQKNFRIRVIKWLSFIFQLLWLLCTCMICEMLWSNTKFTHNLQMYVCVCVCGSEVSFFLKYYGKAREDNILKNVLNPYSFKCWHFDRIFIKAQTKYISCRLEEMTDTYSIHLHKYNGKRIIVKLDPFFSF